MDRANHRSSPNDGKQPLLKPALVKTNMRTSKRSPKQVAFVPTLRDVQASLSRKERRAGLALSDHATMGTVDFERETGHYASSSVSLVAHAGSWRRDGFVHDYRPEPLEQNVCSHLRNISNTAVFGDETRASSEKDRHASPLRYSESLTNYSSSSYDRASDRAPNMTPTVSLALLLDNPSLTNVSVENVAPDSASLTDKVYNNKVSMSRSSSAIYDYSTCVPSTAHASKTKTAGDVSERKIQKTWHTQPTTSTTGLSCLIDSDSLTPQAAVVPSEAMEADQSVQQHTCCVGVLSAFETEHLSDEDKQAILQGGCHGLRAAQATFINQKSREDEAARDSPSKPSPPTRGPSDRPARFISAMPSDIMPNGRRGGSSSLPRFSRRRVAAEYKKPRAPLAIVQPPACRAGNRSGLPLVDHNSHEHTSQSSHCHAGSNVDGNTVSHARSQKLSVNPRKLVTSVPHVYRHKLKRQAKHRDMRRRFRSHEQLAKKVDETTQAKEKPPEAVQTSSYSVLKMMARSLLSCNETRMRGSKDGRLGMAWRMKDRRTGNGEKENGSRAEEEQNFGNQNRRKAQVAREAPGGQEQLYNRHLR